jgi:hypothetical protein
MSRCLSMTTYQRLSAISLMLLCIGGCRSTGSAPSAVDPQAAGSTEVGGPPGDEIQRELIAGLPKQIADHCHKNKQAMIDSVKDLRFVPNKRVLMNTVNGGYKVIEIDGTLYWPYRSKAEGHDPSAGEPFGVTMTNDPTVNDDREAKYEFLAAGPWENLLGFTIRVDCEEF